MLTGRNEAHLTETLDQLEGNGHQAFAGDLTEEDFIRKLSKDVPELDGLVHCAGIVGPTPAKFIRREDIQKMLGINYEAPVLLTASILQRKKLKNGGSIVLMSSVVTRSPYFGGTLYSGAKGAIETYCKTLALELVDRKIRVNCLSPGLVSTPMITDPAKEENPEIVEDSLKRYIAKYPMGVGEAKDVANTVVFLLADESAWISGTNIDMGAVIR